MVKWVIKATSSLLCSRERFLVLIVQETKWIPGLVWTGVEK
jgi:hypothetical protein